MINKNIRRRRNITSRYEYPEDRFNFKLWSESNGPCERPYWRLNERGHLTIEVVRGNKRAQESHTMLSLSASKKGWRSEVALSVARCRDYLSNQASIAEVVND